ncbi:DedA family protein [Cognatiyoonia sp. IB215446]|uniref:DedA family protein n=1 Tax=Cognatiyoonia sp. IB215446 TaxID=3097355 RepID=UPI002A16D8F5|nr:DedA family protein [Cognatiyoonia sp. IB215446]MDX8347970.1 DedA family protein [Cognatiyoonia sp. IB215446]
MTETVLALVPDYGVFLVFGVVLLACLAVPLPASVLVLTSGSFAAAGDISLLTVFLAAVAAYILGDQLAYGVSRKFGPSVLGFFERSECTAPVVEKSKELLQRRGALAVLISHTILSPTCPYVSYLSGAGGLNWRSFTTAAIPGALIWTAMYVGLGYTFASQLEQVATILSNFFGVVLAGAVAVVSVVLLMRRWQAQTATQSQEPTS